MWKGLLNCLVMVNQKKSEISATMLSLHKTLTRFQSVTKRLIRKVLLTPSIAFLQ